ncbi:BglG family transcription antiterminator [Fervidibacillus halotolerans]|uniref:BglG family transcription antiterminator n=1 Tax=Fervidibacillus halotolerans TaxID=2980027 RepID=A0A9E8M0H5_9BACI|nr:BglG family transcription antiterminator [Fervidibacillus halotolerans]WAA13150.1 BglG family transcription antiterminator [Fervidibacillus halotolerans]
MVSKRQAVLLKKLIENGKYVSTRHYAELLDVSERTIHSDLKQLEDVVKRSLCRLDKRPNKGIILIGSKSQKQKLLNHLDQLSQIDLTPLQRKITILQSLIDGKKLSYNQLAATFRVSRSSIASDFKWIKNLCNKVHVRLEYDNSGTYISGYESAIQSLMKKLYLEKFKLEYNRYPAYLNEYHHFLLKTDEINPVILQTSFNLIFNIATKHKLDNHYSINLYNTLFILCKRNQLNKHIEAYKGSILEKIQELENYYIASEIADKIKSVLKINFTKNELIYLNENLVANGITPIIWYVGKDRYHRAVKRLIKRFSNVVNIDLNNDKKLFTNLLNHIIPMIYRLDHGIQLKNPLLSEIKRQYSLMFNITWFVLIDFEQELNIHLPEDEIGFILVHFQSALERNTSLKKILIVCPTGLVTWKLLEERLRKFVPGMFVYEITSSNEIDSYNLQAYDYIITTVPIEMDNEEQHNVFHLSPIPSDQELLHLSQVIANSTDTETILSKIKPYKNNFEIINILDIDLIYSNQSMSSMNMVLNFLITKLEEKNIVDPRYRKSLYLREKLSSTAFEFGVAIPHGNPEYVHKTKLSILVNEKKIVWGKKRVDVILLLSIAKEDKELVGPILVQINDLLSSREKIEQVFIKKSSKEIYQYFLTQACYGGK